MVSAKSLQFSAGRRAGSGRVLDGWSGDCSGTDPVCQVTMDAAKAVTASFGAPVTRVFLPLVVRHR
jgi:hypothetical protein